MAQRTLPVARGRAAGILCLAACASLAALTGCTVPFTPGDAKPAVYTPYPSGAASSPAPASGPAKSP
ncbi:MAG: hypothetical protein KGL68_16340 [Burkholderiales bacterium]|nr:hypothetical protein [Burkholderiales bacterium]